MKKLFRFSIATAIFSFFLLNASSLQAQADQSLIASANAGNTKAMRTLAFCYERGAGVPLDSAAALQWYRRAADAGDGEAWLRVSRYMLVGTYTPADTNRYFAIRKEWADKGLPNGIAALGIAYLGGYGVKVDTAHYVELTKQAAAKGSPWALTTLGDCYTYGSFGFPKDNKKAEQYYKKALKAGDETVTSDLAYFYARKEDYKNAWHYIDESKKWNCPAARSLEAQLNYYGGGVEANELKAQQLIDKLIVDFPNLSPNYELASTFFMFSEHHRDSVKAIGYMKRGAELGNDVCRLRLCSHNVDAGNYEMATKYLRDILDGDGEDENKGSACIAFAQIYRYGLGVEPNEDSMVVWLKRGVERYKSAACASTLAQYYVDNETQDEWGDNRMAVQYYQKAFELGDTDALVDLGSTCFRNGKMDEAGKAFSKYIECGRPDGYYWLAMLYAQIPDDAKTLDALNTGDKKGSLKCREVLGSLYEDGSIGKAPDYKRAEKYYLSAGTSRSYDQLGKLYLSGNLGKQSEKDISKGLDYVRKSADMGYIDAIYRMGYFYETGNFVGEVDHEKALSYYKLLADNGVAAGYFKMGLYYELGDGGVEADSVKSVEYYRRAADLGHGEAMCYLGDFYRIGQFLPKDGKKAFEYYAMADSVGEEIGTYYVARSYLEGCGVDIDSVAAIPYLKVAAASKVGKAAYLLAEFYNYGKAGLPQIEDSATHYYLMAHENGSGEASYYIGSQLIRENHPKEAIQYLYTGARRGNYDCMVLFALCEQEGLGMEANPEDAYVILENVTRRVDNAAAYYYLGMARLNGVGCKQSETLGKLYIDTAAMLGYVRAMTILGVCYLEGYGCAPDTAEAIRWYQKAIDAGSLDACNRLGYIYEAQEDYEKAVACYQKSMEGGNLEGYCCLGLCYEKGHGVILSYKKAYELYSVAAENGFPRGYLMIAFCYLEGINVEVDNVAALKWFEKAGEAGSALGMYNAGSMLEDGEDGVQRDLKRAKYWYTQAAAKGYEPAIEALKRMK